MRPTYKKPSYSIPCHSPQHNFDTNNIQAAKMSGADMLSRRATLEESHVRQISDFQRQLDNKGMQIQALSQRIRETEEDVRELREDVRQVSRNVVAANGEQDKQHGADDPKRQFELLETNTGTVATFTANQYAGEEVAGLLAMIAELRAQIDSTYSRATSAAEKSVNDKMRDLVKENREIRSQIIAGSQRVDGLVARFNDLVQRHNQLSTDLVGVNAVERLQTMASLLQEHEKCCSPATQPQKDVHLGREELVHSLTEEVSRHGGHLQSLFDRLGNVEYVYRTANP